jgi:hypothetical protein
MVLRFTRRARKGVDHVSNGFLYVHFFGTGYQPLDSRAQTAAS